MNPIEIAVQFLIIAVVLYLGFLFLKNNVLIYYFPSLFARSSQSAPSEPAASPDSEPQESQAPSAPPRPRTGAYAHKIYAFLFIAVIAAAIHLGPEGLNNLINNPSVSVSIDNVEISTYVDSMDRAPVKFDIVLSNRSKQTVQVGSLKIEGDPEQLSGSVPVNKALDPGEELTIPIERQGVVPHSILRNTQLNPSALEIKVILYDQAGNQINWTKQEIQYK